MKHSKKITALLIALGLSGVVSCSTESQYQRPVDTLPPTTPITTAASASESASTPPSNGQDGNSVSLTILSPKPGEVVHTSDVPVTFDLKNYSIEPNGQHIHVILDNEPYQPCYTTATPFVLKGVTPGLHTLRAFPSRAWHESIKDPTAFAETTFYVEKKKGDSPVNFNKPLLTYSRPKGKYEGDKAKKILFDFFLTNVQLSKNGYKVRYTLDNERPQLITEWKPTYFENLAPGKHKLVVELINNKGHILRGDYNRTEREFEVAK